LPWDLPKDTDKINYLYDFYIQMIEFSKDYVGKVVKLILITLVVTPMVFLGYRFHFNKTSEVPYPYVFKDKVYQNLPVDAPILIIGDRLGKRLASFSNYLSETISTGLSKPIKIQSIATEGEGLHRTIKKIKNLPKVPLITIYLGGSEEFFEQKFLTKDIKKIIKNFEVYSDDRIKTLLMIFPSLSRFVYDVINYQHFGEKPEVDGNNYSDSIIQQRNMIHFKLFEQEVNELFSFLKERGSYLIALTQPLNFDISPAKNCVGSIDDLSKQKLEEVVELVKKKDYKSAYNISKELVLIANASAKVYYIHGKIAKNLGKLKEGIKHLKLAMAYDCKQWRGNLVYNKIMKKAAYSNDVQILDFQKMLEEYWTKNVLFIDEIYPQNYYFERTADVLAARIKKLLKL
jgi:hypothetical protein